MAVGFGPDGPGAAGKPGTIEDPATLTFERVGSTEIARGLTPAFGGRGVGPDLTGALMNLVAEGLQLLEDGAFVRVSWNGGHPHYMATRRGRGGPHRRPDRCAAARLRDHLTAAVCTEVRRSV